MKKNFFTCGLLILIAIFGCTMALIDAEANETAMIINDANMTTAEVTVTNVDVNNLADITGAGNTALSFTGNTEMIAIDRTIDANLVQNAGEISFNGEVNFLVLSAMDNRINTNLVNARDADITFCQNGQEVTTRDITFMVADPTNNNLKITADGKETVQNQVVLKNCSETSDGAIKSYDFAETNTSIFRTNGCFVKMTTDGCFGDTNNLLMTDSIQTADGATFEITGIANS